MRETSEHATTVEQTPALSPKRDRLHKQVEQPHHARATLRDTVCLVQEHTGSSDTLLAASQLAIEPSHALLEPYQQEPQAPLDPPPTNAPRPPQRHARNQLLAQLRPEDRDRYMPFLRAVQLKRNQALDVAGDAIATVYFPTTAVLALVCAMHDGHITGLGTVGRAGMVGIPLLLGASASPFAMVVQVAGTALAPRADSFRDEVSLHGQFDRLLLLYAQTFLNQVSQTLACNSHHPVPGRMAVWLLRLRDAHGSDEIPVTQEFLALMLGVGRPSVSLAAQTLAKERLIRFRHGVVTITDGPGLEAVACACYQVVHAEDARLLMLMSTGEMWRR